MSNIIEINNLNYLNIFENLSITVEKNSFITISGPNNCGKTSLIRLLSNNSNETKDIYLGNLSYTSYKKEELIKKVQTIIPGEIRFSETNLEEELYYYSTGKEKQDEIFLNYLVENLNLSKIINKNFKELTNKEIFLSQLALSLITKPLVIAIDDIDKYLNREELKNLFEFLRDYQDKFELTLVVTSLNLDVSLYTDYLYIIHNNKVFLEGKPLEVLEKDNILNKVGLSLPFMVDLSVKLRDYDLVEEIETDMDRMVDKLWK